MTDLVQVHTAHSIYTIDFDTRTFQRQPVHPNANDLTEWQFGPDDTNYFQEIAGLAVDQRLIITTPDGGWVKSTPVLRIEELSD